MKERLKELLTQAAEYAQKEEPYDRLAFNLVHWKKFYELMIVHATECVRDVLREENSPLTYEAADMVQKRIKEYFGVE